MFAPPAGAVDLTVECVDAAGNPAAVSAEITVTGHQNPGTRTLLSNFGQPVTFLQLEPGRYDVEIRGELAPSVLETVDLSEEGMLHTLVVQLPRSRRPLSSATATVNVSQLRASPRALKEVARGEALLARGHLAGARAHFLTALAADPNAAAAHNDLAIAALGEGDLPQARAEFTRALELDPQNPRIANNVARLAYREADWQWVEQVAPRSLAGGPDNPQTLAWLAEAEFHLGKCAEAISAAARLHALPHEKFTGIHVLAARCSFVSGDRASAQRELQRFLDEEPHSPLAPGILLQIEALDSASSSDPPGK